MGCNLDDGKSEKERWIERLHNLPGNMAFQGWENLLQGHFRPLCTRQIILFIRDFVKDRRYAAVFYVL